MEETVQRMGRALGLRQVDCFAVPSGLFITWQREDGSSQTCLTRVRRDATALWRVDGVNAVSRAVVAGELTPDQALARLERLKDEKPPYPSWLVILGAALCGASFTVMFGGGWMEFLVTAITAALAQAACQLVERRRAMPLVAVMIGSFVSALLPGLAALRLTLLTDVIIAGAVMPFVPGLAMTNAVADLIRGDMLSGISHGFSALLTAGMIALGTVLASGLLRLLGGI